MSETGPRAGSKPARTKSLACPNCGGTIEVRANGISVSAVCASCGSTIDLASPDLRIIAGAQANLRTPLIGIGTRGRLAGTVWEVIGFQQRSNAATGWSWEEYLLFNPYRGFRFLAHDDEGWTLYCMLRQDVPNPPKLEGDPRHYADETTGTARTDYVLGEFYWRAKVGDVAELVEWSARDHVLSCERTGEEIIWSRGIKLEPRLVREGFGLGPLREEIRAASERDRTMAVVWTGVAGVLLLLLLHSVSFGASRSLRLFSGDFRVAASERSRPVVTGGIIVPDAAGNLRIDVTCALANDWAEFTLSLVPDGAGRSFNAVQSIEYYSGYDADGSWTEGGREGSVLFRDVPGGTYHLLVEVDGGVFHKVLPPPSTGVNFNAIFAQVHGLPPPPVQADPPAPPEPALAFGVVIERHVPASELFWIGLLLLLPYPLYRWFFRRSTAA